MINEEKERVVLIQGPILLNKQSVYFEKCLEKTMSCINSENIKIIVSTWEIDKNLKYKLTKKYPSVEFIFSSCPPSLELNLSGCTIRCNVNRLIESTKYGLRNIANNAIVLKIRTDSYLTNLSAFHLFEQSLQKNYFRNKSYKIYSHFVLNLNLFIRNPDSHMPFLYHFGDISMVGFCSDLKKIFNIPFATEKIFKIIKETSLRTNYALVSEQYIFLKSLEINKKEYNTNVHFKQNFEYQKNEIDKSNQYLINNFIFYDVADFGVKWPKYKKRYYCKGWSSLYDFNDWKNLQNKYNGTDFTVSRNRIIIKNILFRLAKIYFSIRNTLLGNDLIFKLAYKLFAKR